MTCQVESHPQNQGIALTNLDIYQPLLDTPEIWYHIRSGDYKDHKHIKKVSLPWRIIVPPHGRHIKVDIEPLKGELLIVTSNKHLLPWEFIPYNWFRGVHFCMITPLKWWSIVLKCGLKNILNIISQTIVVCAIQKIMYYFNINLRGSHITTQIELWISNSLQ